MITTFAASRASLATVFLCSLIALPAVAVAAERGLGADPAAACTALSGAGKGPIKIDAAGLIDPKPLTVAEAGPTPAARISPATPQFCRVLGHYRTDRSKRSADRLKAPVTGKGLAKGP